MVSEQLPGSRRSPRRPPATSSAYRSALPSGSTRHLQAQAKLAAMVPATGPIRAGGDEPHNRHNNCARRASPRLVTAALPRRFPPSGLGSTSAHLGRHLAPPSASAESERIDPGLLRRRPVATTRYSLVDQRQLEGRRLFVVVVGANEEEHLDRGGDRRRRRQPSSPSTLMVATMLNGPDAGCRWWRTASDEVQAPHRSSASTTTSARVPRPISARRGRPSVPRRLDALPGRLRYPHHSLDMIDAEGKWSSNPPPQRW